MGGGLYPWEANSLKFVVPNIYSPTKWVRRKLTRPELWRVMDAPDRVASLGTSDQLTRMFKGKSMVPIKVLVHVLEMVFGYFQCKASVGEALTSLRDTRATKVPRLHVEAGERADSALKRNLVSARADDAEIPEHIWDQALNPRGDPVVQSALYWLREFALRWWRSCLRREFLLWFFKKHPVLKKISSDKALVLGRKIMDKDAK